MCIAIIIALGNINSFLWQFQGKNTLQNSFSSITLHDLFVMLNEDVRRTCWSKVPFDKSIMSMKTSIRFFRQLFCALCTSWFRSIDDESCCETCAQQLLQLKHKQKRSFFLFLFFRWFLLLLLLSLLIISSRFWHSQMECSSQYSVTCARNRFYADSEFDSVFARLCTRLGIGSSIYHISHLL